MARFKYKALDNKGNTVKGELEAISEDAAYESIKARRLDVFEIHVAKKTRKRLRPSKNVKAKDLARYVRQLATLLSAGVTLLEALKSLSRSDAHPLLSIASDNIRKDLRSGVRLSVAMEKHLPTLPPYVPRLAELGEATGLSAKALTDAAERMEFEDSMRQEIRTAMSYPMFLAVIGGAIVLLMFLFVVPRFGTLIGDNRDNLPLISKWVIGSGMALKEHTLLIFGGIGLTIFSVMVGFKRYNLGPRLRTYAEGFPVLGPVLVRADLGGWCRTVGIALDNGADLLSALRLGEHGLHSLRLKRAFELARTDIRAGKNIDDVLELAVPDFDPLTLDLIRTGRTSGELPKMLLFVGKTEEAETRELAKRLSSLAEPIAILFISLIVGTIVISIVLAMTSLYDFDI